MIKSPHYTTLQVNLLLDGDMEQQRPDTPVFCASENSVPSDALTLLSSTDPEHRGVNVHHLERWRDRIEIRHYLTVTSARSSQVNNVVSVEIVNSL